jgi:hypothetical protein
MNKTNKILIEKYLNGELNADELATVRQLVITDNNFNERLEIKKAFRQVEDLQSELSEQKKFEQWLTDRQKKRAFVKQRNYAFVGIACLILFVGVGLFFSGFFDANQTFTYKANYYETNFKGGFGMAGNNESNKPELAGAINLKFIENTSTNDTTYRLFGSDSLTINLPKISSNFKKQAFSVIYNYHNDSTFLVILPDTFVVNNNQKFEKLLKYKK